MSEPFTRVTPDGVLSVPRQEAPIETIRVRTTGHGQSVIELPAECSEDEVETGPVNPPCFIICTELLPDLPSSTYASSRTPSETHELPLQGRKMWPVRTIIPVSFGRPDEDILSSEAFKYVVARVKTYAKIWSRYANIYFNFIDGPFQEGRVRIAFVPGPGHYSYVGMVEIDRSQPTMNLDPREINDPAPEDRFRRVVLHQFGHALGFTHEQSQPKANISWNKDKVYDYYKENFNWNRAKVDFNVLKEHRKWTFKEGHVPSTDFDPDSIMQYDVGSDFAMDGKACGGRTVLSNNDKHFAWKCYPTESGLAGTFNIQSGVTTQSTTPTLTPLPPVTVEEILRGRQPRKVLLGVTRVTADATLKLRSDFDPSPLINESKLAVLLSSHAGPNDGQNSTYCGSWLSLTRPEPDIHSGHFTHSLAGGLWEQTAVEFPKPYPLYEMPKVLVWLHSVESTAKDGDPALHSFDVSVANVSSTSFQILCTGSSDCQLGISWLSYPPTRLNILSGSFFEKSGSKKGAWDHPFKMSLPGKAPLNPIKMFVAFSGITALGDNASVSLEVPKDSITPQGMSLHIRPSKETSLICTTVTYIAIDYDERSMDLFQEMDEKLSL